MIDPAYRSFVSYIDKSREFYGAHGYERPYQWAYHADTPPFAPLPGLLATLRLGVVTTTFPPLPSGQERPPKQAYAAPVDPPPTAMFTEDLSWDKDATHTDDPESFLPLARLGEQVAAGRLGSLSPRFYGVPTEYSQRRTLTVDAPAILDLLREDGVDVALLVPL
ncbi:MAG: hypothetical protein AB7O92_27985 [Acidimicrobiia bacterium]